MKNPYLEGRNYGSFDNLFQQDEEDSIEIEYQNPSYSNWENNAPLPESIAFKIFVTALHIRIQGGKSCGKTPDGKSFDTFSNLAAVMSMSCRNGDGVNYYKSKLGGYFKELIKKHPILLRFSLNDYKENNYYYQDQWVLQYGIGYRHDVVSHEDFIKKPIKSAEKIETEKPKVIEKIVDKQEVKTENTKIKELLKCNDFDDILTQSTKGRPVGSKNKKPQKEICFPVHEIKIIDDRVDEESLIEAVADLVWRKPGQKDKIYLDNLIMSDHHRKFVNQLFINKNKKIKNNYWKFEKSGDDTVLVPICKRLGYYHMNSSKVKFFWTLLKLSNYLKIKKSTLHERLKYESISEIGDSLKNN